MKKFCVTLFLAVCLCVAPRVSASELIPDTPGYSAMMEHCSSSDDFSTAIIGSSLLRAVFNSGQRLNLNNINLSGEKLASIEQIETVTAYETDAAQYLSREVKKIFSEKNGYELLLSQNTDAEMSSKIFQKRLKSGKYVNVVFNTIDEDKAILCVIVSDINLIDLMTDLL